MESMKVECEPTGCTPSQPGSLIDILEAYENERFIPSPVQSCPSPQNRLPALLPPSSGTPVYRLVRPVGASPAALGTLMKRTGAAGGNMSGALDGGKLRLRVSEVCAHRGWHCLC